MCVVPEPYGGDFTIYSSTQIPHILKIHARDRSLGLAGAPSARRRARGRWRVRLEAQRLRRRGALPRAREAAGAAGALERGPHREHAGDGARSRHDPGHRAGRRRATAASPRCACSSLADMGAYLQLVTPGIPLLGAFLYHGVYDIPAYSFSCTACSPTRRRPTRTAAPAGPRRRTRSSARSTRSPATMDVDPGRDPAPQLHPRRTSSRTRRRPASCSTAANYEPALDQRARDGRLRRAARRAARTPARRGDTQLPRHRHLVVRRDVRARAEPGARSLNYGGGGWEHATVRVLPTGHGARWSPARAPHGQGHETSLVDDRRRPARRAASTTSRCCTPTPRSRTSVSTPTARARSSVGGMALHLACARCSTRRARSPRTSSRWPRPTSSSSTASSGSGHADASRCRSRRSRSRRSPPTTCPTAWSRTSRPTRRTTRRTSRSRSACTSRSSRSTRRPAASSCVRYVAVDDCGNQINPLIVEGQMHGGIVQGVAQALWEEAVYDESGQPPHRRR